MADARQELSKEEARTALRHSYQACLAPGRIWVYGPVASITRKSRAVYCPEPQPDEPSSLVYHQPNSDIAETFDQKWARIQQESKDQGHSWNPNLTSKFGS